MVSLPRMKLSDRITWAVLCWIFFNLLWLRFLEKFISQGVGALLATAGAVVMVLYWPRPLEEGDEEEPVPGNAQAVAGERRE